MNQWTHVKGVENPVDMCTRGMSIEGLKEFGWLNGTAWLQTDEEKWPNPCCQVNKVETAQANITVARLSTGEKTVASTKVKKSTFTARGQEEAEESHQSRRNPSSRTNFVLICSKRKLPE